MSLNNNPLVTIVLFGGSIIQKRDLVVRTINLYPPNGEYEFVLITDKKEQNSVELNSINNTVPIKILGMKKGFKSINDINIKVLKNCKTNYVIYQHINEKLYDIKKFIKIIKGDKKRDRSIVTFTTPFKTKEQYLIEDLPLLFCDKNLSNIAFSLSSLNNSNSVSSDRYEWKVNVLLNSQNVFVIREKINSVYNNDDIMKYFAEITDYVNEFLRSLNRININKYIQKNLIKNFYELIISSQIGEAYRDIINKKKGNKQVEFLNQFGMWIKEIDIQILSSIPAIRYFFIRWSIDHYRSLGYKAKRQHIKILKYIIQNMHYDSHQIYMKKYSKLYPAAISACKLNSIIPIYVYLIKRKLIKLKNNYKVNIINEHRSINN